MIQICSMTYYYCTLLPASLIVFFTGGGYSASVLGIAETYLRSVRLRSLQLVSAVTFIHIILLIPPVAIDDWCRKRVKLNFYFIMRL